MPGRARFFTSRTYDFTICAAKRQHRLFEAGLPIERVALVTGHKDWETLRRYTRLKPEDLVKLQPPAELSVADYIDQLMDP